jgi:hypothetical protein
MFYPGETTTRTSQTGRDSGRGSYRTGEELDAYDENPRSHCHLRESTMEGEMQLASSRRIFGLIY